MRIVVLTSQSDSFWDLANQNKKLKPRINKSNSGSIGDYCRNRDINLPSSYDEGRFSKWVGPSTEVLAGPVVEVTKFIQQFRVVGRDVHDWYLTSSLGWIRGSDDYHPLWADDIEWYSAEVPAELVECVDECDVLIAAFPSQIIQANPSLQDLLSTCDSVALASGRMGHEMVNLKSQGLRVFIRGVARFGEENRTKIFYWMYDMRATDDKKSVVTE